MVRVYQIWFNRIITGYFCTAQKASVGMYSRYCLCTFWSCHPYFILQFYSIVFILVPYSLDQMLLSISRRPYGSTERNSRHSRIIATPHLLAREHASQLVLDGWYKYSCTLLGGGHWVHLWANRMHSLYIWCTSYSINELVWLMNTTFDLRLNSYFTIRTRNLNYYWRGTLDVFQHSGS